MTYIRGNVAEFDAWEQHGNPGWNWNALLPYFKKSEEYTVPTASQLAAGATYEPQYHGFKGPLHVGYIPALENGSYAPVVIETWKSLSVAHNPDLNSGSVRGFGMGPQTLDTKLNIRWDAARAYYHPAERRPNLRILKGTVKRITWASGKSKKGALVAKGVEVLTDDGKSNVINVKKEVIVSAGALRTPLVLEASGIGNPRYVNPVLAAIESPLISSYSSNLATVSSSPSALKTKSIFQGWERTLSSNQAISSFSPATCPLRGARIMLMSPLRTSLEPEPPRSRQKQGPRSRSTQGRPRTHRDQGVWTFAPLRSCFRRNTTLFSSTMPPLPRFSLR